MSVAFENIARNYLHASADYLLEFADGDRVLQWQTGETIAYRQQLAEVLKPLRGAVSPPPFLGVMLIMSALRDNWEECSRLRATLMRIVTDARSTSNRQRRFAFTSTVPFQKYVAKITCP